MNNKLTDASYHEEICGKCKHFDDCQMDIFGNGFCYHYKKDVEYDDKSDCGNFKLKNE